MCLSHHEPGKPCKKSKKKNLKFNATIGGDNVSDNISDITYRSKSGFRRNCCQEKDKIMSDLQKKNKKKASNVRNSLVIAKVGSNNRFATSRSPIEKK